MRSSTPRPLILYSLNSIHHPASPFSTTSSSTIRKQRHDEDSKALKVTVWWDFENCSIPSGISPYRVAHRIMSALRSNGIKGPATITAFGNVLQLSHATQDALCTTGICINHVPNCGKNSTDRSILADLVYWVAQNPPPAHFFLISGDKDFASILHRLRMSNYNILIAGSDRASTALLSAATIMWHWNELVRGEELAGKHFNHPPDGTYGSWYGHCKNALEDPFWNVEESTFPQPEESDKVVAEYKPRLIPKTLVNKISQILASKPKGITICELHNELRRSGSYFDKDYFGHKKLSSLVSSLTDIATVKPHPAGESDLVAYSARAKSRESVQATSGPYLDEMVDCGDKDQSVTGEEGAKRGADMSISYEGNSSKTSKRKISAESSLFSNDSHQGTLTGSIPQKYNSSVETDVSTSNKALSLKASKRSNSADTNLSLNDSLQDTSMGDAVTPTAPEGNDSDGTDKKVGFVGGKNREGILMRIWSSLGSLFRQRDVKNKHENSDHFAVADDSMSKESENSVTKSENISLVEGHSEHFSVVGEITGNRSNDHTVNGEELSNSNLNKESHYLFSQDHFWDSLESFLRSPKGSELVSKAMTRKHLMMRLQAEGPLFLGSLKDHHFSKLIDLLMSKKWVVDSSSQRFPFRVVLPNKRNFVTSQASGSDGRVRMFSSRGSQSISHVTQGLEGSAQKHSCGSFDSTPPRNLVELKAWFRKTFKGNGSVKVEDFKKQFEKEYGRMVDINLYGFCNMDSLLAACSFFDSCIQDGNKSNHKSRNEILADCQKLVNEALDASPAGVLLSNIKPMFIDRYGYGLDYRRLGYTKLAELLNTLPDVKVNFDLILPERSHADSGSGKTVSAELVNSDSVPGKDKTVEVDDSPWAELGPITEKATPETRERKKEGQVQLEMVTLSDEESSDPESSHSNDSSEFKVERKIEKNDEKSSLLQILESWEKSKANGNNNQRAGDNAPDCFRNGSSFHASPMNSDFSTSLKWKSSKKYNFVTDSGGSNGADASSVPQQ